MFEYLQVLSLRAPHPQRTRRRTKALIYNMQYFPTRLRFFGNPEHHHSPYNDFRQSIRLCCQIDMYAFGDRQVFDRAVQRR
jgi:hypothetical protein